MERNTKSGESRFYFLIVKLGKMGHDEDAREFEILFLFRIPNVNAYIAILICF